jgi:hypothetical protein
MFDLEALGSWNAGLLLSKVRSVVCCVRIKRWRVENTKAGNRPPRYHLTKRQKDNNAQHSSCSGNCCFCVFYERQELFSSADKLIRFCTERWWHQCGFSGMR